MTRLLMAGAMLVLPAMTLLTAAGCDPEVRTVHKTERVEESEPQMVSPGEPVLE